MEKLVVSGRGREGDPPDRIQEPHLRLGQERGTRPTVCKKPITGRGRRGRTARPDTRNPPPVGERERDPPDRIQEIHLRSGKESETRPTVCKKNITGRGKRGRTARPYARNRPPVGEGEAEPPDRRCKRRIRDEKRRLQNESNNFNAKRGSI